MSFASLLENTFIGTPATYKPTTFGENIESSWESAKLTNPFSGNAIQYYDQIKDYDARESFIKQNYGRDFDEESRDEVKMDIGFLPFTSESARDYRDRRIKKKNELIDSFIAEGRAKEPEKFANIKTTAEIQAPFLERVRKQEQETAEIQAKAESGFARIGGALVGGGGASILLDPVNLATLPLGAGAGYGILRGALLDGALNMGIEAYQTPEIKRWRESIGLKYGLGEAAINIATAGVGGAALSGVVRGTVKGFDKSREVLSTIMRDKTAPSEVRDAAKYMERVAHIDESIPPRSDLPETAKAERAAISEHRTALQETQEAFNNYSSPKYKDIPFDINENIAMARASRFFESGPQISGKYANYTKPNVPELRAIENIIGELRQAEKGSIAFIERDGVGSTPDVIAAQQSTFPKWFRDANKRGESLSRDAIFKTYEKMKLGAPLGKKEIRIANTLFAEAQGLRNENVRQFLLYKEQKAYKEQLEIDAVAEREMAAMADDYFNTQPNQAQSMADDVKSAGSDKVANAYGSEFARLVQEKPDLVLDMEDGSSLSLREIADQILEDEKILDAVRICGVGV